MTPGAERIRTRTPRYWDAPLVVTGLFLVFIVARYMQWGARRQIFETIRIEFVLGLALTVICGFVISSRPVPVGRLKPARNVLVGIVLLFAAMLVQIPFAADKTLAQNMFIDRVIKFAMMTFFMVALIRSPKAMRWFLGAFLFACFYVTQEATRGLISGGLVWENQGIMRLHGAVPIYAHPNSLSGMAMGALPFCIFLFPAIRGFWYRMLLLPLAGTASTCVLFSGSRTGYVAVAFLLLFWWSKTKRKMRTLAIMVLTVSLAVPLLPDQYVERFKSIGGQEAEGNSKEARIVILEDALKVLQRYPAGVGVASFPAVRAEMFNRSQDTHNLYLEVATNLGLQGLAVFILLIYTLIRGFAYAEMRFGRYVTYLARLRRRSHLNRSQQRACDSLMWDARILRGTAVAGSGFIVIRLALGLFGMDLYEPYWWFASGLCIALIYMARLLSAHVLSLGRFIEEHEI